MANTPAAVEQAIERLELLLQEKEAELAQLRHEEEERNTAEAWSWTIHRIRAADPSAGLPVPRLEIRYRALDGSGYNVEALYCIVYRHFTAATGGLRCDDSKDCLVFVPMGSTTLHGTNSGARHPRPESGLWDGRMYGPIRDGAHIRHDMAQLKLPGFIIATDGDVYRIDLDEERRHREEWNRAHPDGR